MYRLPAFKGAARQRGCGIGGIFKGVTRTFAPVVKNGLLNLGKKALQSGVQVLDNVSRGEDVKAAIKRRAAEGAKKMGKKNISRDPTKETSVISELPQGADLQQLRRKEYQKIFCKWV